MTAPTYAWTSLSDGETQADQVFPVTELLAMRNNCLHIREFVLDPDVHTAAISHSHDGTNSGLLALPSPNLLPTASLNTSVAGNKAGEWFFSKSVKFGAYNSDPGARMQNAGEYIMTELGAGDDSDEDDLPSDVTFGAGATLVVSFYAKTTSTLTSGIMQCGLSDASDSEFIEGCLGWIHYTDLTTSWKRFWLRCDPGDVSDGLYFLVRIEEGFDVQLRVDAPSVTLGPHLGWWAPMPNDKIHYNHQYVSNAVPIYDETVSITGAVRLPAG